MRDKGRSMRTEKYSVAVAEKININTENVIEDH
jgi:hypothetical protein